RWLGVGFTNLLHLYSPDVLVVGGGIANGLDLMAPVIGATIRQRAMRAYRDVPVVQAQLGRHAGLVGAASLVLFDDGGTLTARMPAGPSTYPERRRDFNG
ncbi:MAG: ROK family protein, partial [Mesorhizobium sp.]